MKLKEGFEKWMVEKGYEDEHELGWRRKGTLTGYITPEDYYFRVLEFLAERYEEVRVDKTVFKEWHISLGEGLNYKHFAGKTLSEALSKVLECEEGI